MLEIGLLNLSLIALGLIVLLIVLSIVIKGDSDLEKGILFGGIVVISVGYTAYLSGSTIYKNITSETKGPVHWHADFQIWKCGQEVKLKSPEGLSNRIGTTLLHEHGDKRIHVEGAVENLMGVSLGSFFSSIGGDLGNDELVVPTDNNREVMRPGEKCNNEDGYLQVFVYSVNNKLIEQRKLDSPREYLMARETMVPPGNCIIFEFDLLKNRTDHLCQSYQAAKDKGDLYGR
jgi:hypothetical protein